VAALTGAVVVPLVGAGLGVLALALFLAGYARGDADQ